MGNSGTCQQLLESNSSFPYSSCLMFISELQNKLKILHFYLLPWNIFNVLHDTFFESLNYLITILFFEGREILNYLFNFLNDYSSDCTICFVLDNF